MASSGSKDVTRSAIKLPVFKGAKEENFSNWMFQFKAFLMGIKVWKVVEKQMENASYTIPVMVDKLKREEVKSRIQEAYSVLVTCLGDAALETARSCATQELAAVLKELNSTYNSQTSGRRLAALRSLLNTGPKPGQDIEQFCNKKVTTARDELNNTVSISEILALSVLGNVGDDYRSTSVPLLAEDVTNFDTIKKNLMACEQNLGDFGTEDQKSRALLVHESKTAEEALADKEKREEAKERRQLIAAMAKFVSKRPWSTKGSGKKGFGKGKGKKGVSKSNFKQRTCWICGSTKHEKKNCPDFKGPKGKKKW